MFGVGPQEMVIIGLLLLIVFGPSKLPSMARDVGRFVNQARRYKDEFQSELVAGAERDEHPEYEKTFNLSIKQGAMTPDEITVDEGDEVSLWITSDSPTEVYLSGYDLSASVEPGKTSRVPFDAMTNGRFDIENRSSDPHEVLGELVVRPH
jgi:TatA/E family protein of Tat protein translocase